MNGKTPEVSLTQAEIDALNKDYKNYIEQLQRRWLRENNHPHGHRLYELDPEERKRVDALIRSWEQYVTPFAERWWKRRGLNSAQI